MNAKNKTALVERVRALAKDHIAHPGSYYQFDTQDLLALCDLAESQNQAEELASQLYDGSRVILPRSEAHALNMMHVAQAYLERQPLPTGPKT